jgi:Transport protein particle (TRAPP) component
VSLSAFALLFSEMIQYSQNRVESISDLERRCGIPRKLLTPPNEHTSFADIFNLLRNLSAPNRLEDSGYSIGQRVTELIGLREHIIKRETRIVNMLQVIHEHFVDLANDDFYILCLSGF